MDIITSLANGILASTEVAKIYQCPNNTQAQTTLISFVNTTSSPVVLNVYKFRNNIKYKIAPNDFIFGANYLAQETDPITLEQGDALYAQCSVANAVQYVVNGNINKQPPVSQTI